MEDLTPTQKAAIKDNLLIIQGWIHNSSLIPFEDLIRNTNPIFSSLIKSISSLQKGNISSTSSTSSINAITKNDDSNSGSTDQDTIHNLRSENEALKKENEQLRSSSQCSEDSQNPPSPTSNSNSDLQYKYDLLLKENLQHSLREEVEHIYY